MATAMLSAMAGGCVVFGAGCSNEGVGDRREPESVGTTTSAYSVSSPKRVAYYPVWSSTGSDTQVSYPQPLGSIPWNMITHINIAFAGINRSDQCAWVLADGQTADTTSQNNAKALVNYRNSNWPNVKILVSVGGATMSDGFSDSAQDSSHRSAFVTSCVNLMNNIGADGLDWDWEYPGQWDYTPQSSNFPGGTGDCPSYRTYCSRTTDVSNYTAMLNAFRANSGMNGKLMTAAVRPNRSGDSNNVNYQYSNFFSTTPRNFDFVNLMTYDDFGTWASSVNFCAPYDWATSAMGYWSSQVGSTYNDSLVLGVPFYGPAWQNISSNPPDSTGVNSGNLTGTQIAASFRGEGNVSFGKAKATFVQGHSSNCSVKTPTSNYSGYPTNVDMRYVYCSGTVSGVNVEGTTENLTNTWISYEDAFVIQNKANYVAANNYGGMMWWSQGEDSSTNELVTTIYNTIQTSTVPEGPYNGTAAAIPGTIQAANYDVGTGYMGTCSSAPSSAAYCDTTAGNSLGQYRTDDVDIELSGDTGGGYDVGFIAVGEFLKYTVNVAPATYNMSLRLASAAPAGQTMHVEFDGTNVSGTISIPNTGGWQTYQTVTVNNVNLSGLTSGNHVMKVVFDTAGLNITNIQFTVPNPPPVGSTWSNSDIGSPSPAGSWSLSSGTYTVSGGGADIYGTSDQFQFVYQNMTGDQTIVAHVDSISNANSWSKAAIMIRNDLTAGSAFVDLVASPTASNGYHMQVRSAAGASATDTAGPSGCGNGTAPVWLKLSRSSSTFTGWCSSDGSTWTQVGSSTVTMNSTASIGLAVTSHNNGTLASGTFDSVTVSQPAPIAPGPSWSSQDIGAVTAVGSWSQNNGTFTVNGSGSDIYGTGDQFRFVYQQVTGDATVTAHVASINNVGSAWSKAGVMMRDGLTGSATDVLMLASPTTSNNYRWQVRSAAGGSTTSAAPSSSCGSGAAPVWVKIQRSGSTLTGSCSSDGNTWVQVGTTTISMSSTIQIGVAVTSHVNGTLATGTFDHLSISGSTCTPTTCSALGDTCGSAGDGCGGTLNCGTCGSGQVCTSHACVSDTTAPSTPTGLSVSGTTSSSVSLSWTASSDPDSPVSGYNIYRGGTKVGTSTSPSYTDTGLAASTSYTYTVSAYDPGGNTSAQSSSASGTTNPSSCSISVTTNTYDTTYDGNITYKNTGTGTEQTPTVKFTVPSGATLDTAGCAMANQSVPSSITALSCSQSGTTITYAFTGSLAAGSSIGLYYTTQNASEPAATNVTVTATSCP